MGQKGAEARAKQGRRSTHITASRNEAKSITTDSVVFKEIKKEYYEQLYTHKFDNFGEID